MLPLLPRLLITGLLLALSVAARAAPPPAGTLISNTASDSFVDPASGLPVSLRSNTVNVTVADTAVLAVALTSSTNSTTAGATFNLTASALNNGGGAANPVAVTVNGASASLFLLSLQVPANTRFASTQSISAGAQLLYHVLGTTANTYVTAPPAGATVDGVAWSLPALAPGATLAGQLSVTVNSNASGSLTAVASTAWANAPQGSLQSTPSNTVVVQLPVRAASIAYFTSTSYVTPSVSGLSGRPLFVQVDAALCNTDPTRALTAPVTLTSRLTGDVELFTAVETAANTGLFRIQPDVPTANAATHVVASGDGILEVLPNDLVTATVTHCGGVTVSATTTLLIDPSGVVYDERTNQPVAGATVQLIDVTGGGNGGNGGGPARVLLPDGTTPAPSSVITRADGRYAFPIVAPSTYRLVVTPPAGYVFPSKLSPALQPAGRFLDPRGSYGHSFTISGTQSEPVHFDLPLDPGASRSGLLIDKTADPI